MFRFLNLYLFIGLFVSVNLFADGTEPVGSGTESDPYQVETLDNLLWVSTNSSSWNSHFIQTSDIDASDTQNWNNGDGFQPIGEYPNNPFSGSYNGQNHIIDGLFINREMEYNIGLFGFTEGTVIENVGLLDVNILGESNVGGLVGYLRIQCIVNNCYVEGSVSGHSSVGGLVGDNRDSLISDCYTSCSVNGDYMSSNRVGGIVGENRSDSIIDNCYALGSVFGFDVIGGIVGLNNGSMIVNCYATGDIEGITPFPGEMIGGLVGSNCGNSIIENSYFVGSVSGNIQSGGLVGQNNSFIIDESCAIIINSFYNYDTVLINGEHIITIGALYDEQFNNWLENDLFLDINDYLTFDGENYLLTDVNDFKQLLAFGQSEDYSFALINDISLENEENFFIPYFAGTLHGNSHIINNLNISTNALFRYGLFSNLFNASIENLILDNVNIYCSEDYMGCGGLAGSSFNSIISNVQIAGSIGNENFSPSGFYLTGGLVGFCGDTTISDCFVSGICYGPVLGGFVGYSSNSTISNCNVNNTKVGSGVGGLVSINDNSIISNCFAEGTIEMLNNSGGLVALNENNSAIINSHYNYDAVLINGENILTIGALYETEYNTWLNNNLYLNIDDYLTSNGEYYLINSIDDFKLLLAFGQFSENKFLLTNDIDLNNDNDFFIPYFAGHFNGNNNSVFNLNLNYEFLNNHGLFGYTNNAAIENTKLVNVDIALMGGFNTGSLVGYCDNNSQINNCYVSGSINGSSIIGGLIGCSDNYSKINNCSSDCLINGGSNAGGLIGKNDNFSIISNCFSSGLVEAQYSVGGLVGNNHAKIVNSYSFGSVVGEWDIGGLVGEVYQELSIIVNSFWDTQTSGQTTSAGGTGKTTTEMQDVATYTSLATVGLVEPWDFVGNPFDDVGNEDYWDIDEDINDGYPYFANPFVGVDDEEIIIVTSETPKLIGNYPNPFNPTTTISFSIPIDSKIDISVYNIKGQKVKTVANDLFEKGIYSILWSGDDDNGKFVSSGVYFYKLCVNGETESVKKCLLLK